MRKKIIIVIILLVSLSLIVFGVINTRKNQKDHINDICDEIKANKESKNNFMIFVRGNDINDYVTTGINDFTNDYKISKVINAKNDEIDNECLKKELEDNNQYEEVKSSTIASIIFYENGKYRGGIIGDFGYNSLENYASEIGFIKKHDIQETLTFDNFKNNLKNEYILVMIGEEKARKIVGEHVPKYFSDYKYDIVNTNSDVGQKILQYILDNYTIGHLFPQALYFKNGKLLLDEVVFDTSDAYGDFINEIKELN